MENQTQNPPVELTEDQKKQIEAQNEMCKFVGIDTYDGNTKFINLEFNDRQARTCIILGAFGLHARMKGEYSIVVHNERIAMDEKQEGEYDISLSVRREHVFKVMTARKKRDMEKVPAELKNKVSEYYAELYIKYQDGDITLTGLHEDKALLFKKMLWSWIIFHAPNVQQAQH